MIQSKSPRFKVWVPYCQHWKDIFKKIFGKVVLILGYITVNTDNVVFKSKLFWFQSLRHFFKLLWCRKMSTLLTSLFYFFFSFECCGCNNRCTIVMFLNCFRKQEHNKFHLGANKWDSIDSGGEKQKNSRKTHFEDGRVVR